MSFSTRANVAINKLEKQGNFCKDENGQCFYQNANNSCIIGHIMPDFRTRQKADNYGESGISDLIANKVIPEFTDQFSEKEENILVDLQLLHDTYSGTFENAILKMRRVVQEHKEGIK